MVPSFGAARISCVLLYNGSASALVTLSRHACARAATPIVRAPELRPSERGLASLNTGGSSGGDAGHGVRGSSERNHPAPRKPETARGTSDADATRTYLAG